MSDERYRFIRYGDGFEELYDLRVDPNEFTNLASQGSAKEVIAALSQDIPDDPAPLRKPATDSPYHKKR